MIIHPFKISRTGIRSETVVLKEENSIRIEINNIMIRIYQDEKGIDIEAMDNETWDHILDEFSIKYDDVPEPEEDDYDENNNDDYEEYIEQDDQIIK